MTLEIMNYESQEELRKLIKMCQEDGHVQQVAYSTYHDALTQVCFTCKKVRTSMKEEDYEGQN